MTTELSDDTAQASWTAANWPVPSWGWDALPDDEKQAWKAALCL